MHHVTDEEGLGFQAARMILDEETAEQMVGKFDQQKQQHMQEAERKAA